VCSAFAAAYLIQQHNVSVRLALKRLRKKAKAQPSGPFVLQLEQFSLLCGRTPQAKYQRRMAKSYG
jgi:hypothetical protein